MSEKWDFLGFSGAKIAKIDENLAPKFWKFEKTAPKTVEKLEKTRGKACKAMLHAVCAVAAQSQGGMLEATPVLGMDMGARDNSRKAALHL